MYSEKASDNTSLPQKYLCKYNEVMRLTLKMFLEAERMNGARSDDSYDVQHLPPSQRLSVHCGGNLCKLIIVSCRC